MKTEIKFFLYAFGLGVALVGYAHSNFTSKDISNIILKKLSSLETKVDKILMRGIK